MQSVKLILLLSICSFTLQSCNGQKQNTTDSTKTEISLDSAKTTIEAPQIDTLNKPSGVQPSTGNVEWQSINSFDNTIAFSKISEIGKFSVFLISTPWCGPCKILKDNLSTHPEFAADVNFYYVDMSHKKKYKELKETDAYFYARFYERLKEWPTVVITSPTGSVIKRFSDSDLERECYEKSLYKLFYPKKEEDIPANIDVEKQKQLMKEECRNDDLVYKRTVNILNRLLEHKGRFNADNIITEVNVK